MRKTKVKRENLIEEDSIEWVGAVIKTEENRKYYSSFRYNSTTVEIGDYVYMNPPNHDKSVRDPYWILKVEQLWENKQGMKVSGSWMWRHSDVVVHCCGLERERNILTYDPQQIYYCDSNSNDVNDLNVCAGRCEVLFLESADQFKTLGFSGKHNVFYCLYGFDPNEQTMFKVPSSWIQVTYDRRERISNFLSHQFVTPPVLSVM